MFKNEFDPVMLTREQVNYLLPFLYKTNKLFYTTSTVACPSSYSYEMTMRVSDGSAYDWQEAVRQIHLSDINN